MDDHECQAFRIVEDQYDRYAFYVRQERARLTDDLWTDDKTTEFAVAAWRVAYGSSSGYVPMAPGLIRSHARILSAELYRSQWDGSLRAEIELASERPKVLNSAQTPDGEYWAEWSHYSSLTNDAFYIGEQDVTARPYLVATAQAQFTLPTAGLPDSETLTDPADLEGLALTTVRELVYLLNRQVTPLIELLEKS